jgi:hypothetical protein
LQIGTWESMANDLLDSLDWIGPGLRVLVDTSGWAIHHAITNDLLVTGPNGGRRLDDTKRPVVASKAAANAHHDGADDSIPVGIETDRGPGNLTGARVLAEAGNDRGRFTGVRGLKAFAGSAPITRSRELRVVAWPDLSSRAAGPGGLGDSQIYCTRVDYNANVALSWFLPGSTTGLGSRV